LVLSITGALYDATGDYTYSFYMAGGTLFAAGAICIPLRRISVWYRNRQQQQQQQQQQQGSVVTDEPAARLHNIAAAAAEQGKSTAALEL
jgi:hypothetical protein